MDRPRRRARPAVREGADDNVQMDRLEQKMDSLHRKVDYLMDYLSKLGSMLAHELGFDASQLPAFE